MRTAFVFPGQGSQSVGMGKGFAESFLDEANKILGFDLKQIVLEGLEEELKKTEIQQPAIFVVSVAAFHRYLTSNLQPDAVAGHSLGEYSALYAAGVISFEEAVKIVHLRGKFMQEAVPLGEGAMAAVLGAERKAVEEVCQEVGNVWPANYNCPGQIVISGKKEAVEKTGERLKNSGAKKIIPLAVSAPFHCPLMQPAADKLAMELEKVTFSDPTVTVYANVTAKPVTSGSEVKNLLIKQVTAPVLWEDLIKNMIGDEIKSFVEVGPGKVLTGLIKKIDANLEIKSWGGET